MTSTAQDGVAVVTGAARGFGLEIARRLIQRGQIVLITDLDEVAVRRAVEQLGPRAHGRAADASDPADQRETAAAAVQLGRLTTWVNNAGVARAAKVWEHTDAEVDLTVNVNLLGVIHGSRAAIEVMRESGGGHILNIASMSSFGPVPGLGVYAATKAGVLSITGSLQGDLDLAKIPIRMHALCPDAADTAMVQDVRGEQDAAILFSGTSLLDAGKVADIAVGLLDGRRIVKTVPVYRGLLTRCSAFVPTVALKILALLRRVGERRRVSG